MRSVFSAGLLDGFLQRSFDPFDGYTGVSVAAFRMGRFSTRREQLLEGYRAGLAMAPDAITAWQQALSG